MIKVNVFSGFLGAGKTTLIRKLLKDQLQQEKVVLIENEFGEIGIDKSFLQDSGIEIQEINAGCICCSLTGDFKNALHKVIEEFTPDRIIIEPSGVGKLSEVLKALENMKDIEVDSLCCIVDAKKYKMYSRNFKEFFQDQIQYATTIVLSRSQFLSQAEIANIINDIRLQNKKASLITTPWDQLSSKQICKALHTDAFENNLLVKLMSDETQHSHDHEHKHHHHDANEHFQSWGIETIKTFTKAQLTHLLEALSNPSNGEILRAKGIVKGESNNWYFFDMIPKEFEIREGEASFIGRVCIIGTHLNETAFEKAFKESV